MKDIHLKSEVAMCVRMLEYLGLIDFSGHVSAKVPGKDTILINTWMASRHSLRPEDIYEADLEGKPLDESQKLPSEIHIHTAIYRQRKDVGAIAHLHPPITTALSVTGKPYVPVTHHGAIFSSGIPVYDDCRHVDSRKKGDDLATVLGNRRAVIMRGHGAAVAGESVKSVFFGSVYLEDNAAKLIEAYRIGDPSVLNEEEQEVGDHIWRQPQFDKIWTYYQEKSGIQF